MKSIILTIALLVSTIAFSQTAPTTGKKVLKVKNKFENEYSLDVFNRFHSSPYEYHMKRLPKKLAKYGFTNVEITKLGAVVIAPPKKSSVDGFDVLDAGGSLNQAISQQNKVIKNEEFQVNFNSDQGFFKVRLSMTATGIKYIIKE